MSSRDDPSNDVPLAFEAAGSKDQHDDEQDQLAPKLEDNDDSTLASHAKRLFQALQGVWWVYTHVPFFYLLC
jgi:hypothetical protein